VTYLAWTDAGLSRILGVSRAAIQHAERDGKIARDANGAWDVLAVVRRSRHNTSSDLQRPRQAREFRPWLDPEVPLCSSILAELRRRALAEGAEEMDDGYDEDGDYEE